MARGWESKSVEEQMGAAEAERELQASRHMSADDRELSERKQSLLLSRALTLSRIKVARNPRHRAQLQLALDQLEAQLREFEE